MHLDAFAIDFKLRFINIIYLMHLQINKEIVELSNNASRNTCGFEKITIKK